MRTLSAATLVLVLDLTAFASCKTADAPSPGIPPTAIKAEQSEQTDHVLMAGPRIGPRTHGVPHSTNIDMVTLSDEGGMALTRDSLGGLRLWPSLDGSSEPMLVPVRGALHVSLASAGKSIVISAIDNMGALHILRAKPDGSVQELFMGSPHSPTAEAIVLRGGELLAVLGKDYRLALMSTSGDVKSEIQERRFRPTSIRVAEDKQQILAIESDVAKTGGDVVLKTIDYDVGKRTISLRSGERELSGVFNVASKRFDLSPDGARVAYLGMNSPEKPAETGTKQKPGPRAPGAGPTPYLQITEIETGETQSTDLPVPTHEIASMSVAFSGDREVLVSSRPSGGSWRVTVGEEPTTTPLPSSVANDSQRSASDTAGGTRVAADGTWLFVQDVESKSQHYLGYTAFDPQSGSVSPSGEKVAWSTGATVYIESVTEDSKSVRISAPQSEAYFRSAFIDDKHLVAIDYSGGLHLIDWEAGNEVGRLGTGGPVREFEVDQERGLIRGVRQNGGNWIVELGDSGLVGPHLIQDGGYRSGFLKGEMGIWSMDGASEIRTYSLEEIRKGLGAKQLKREAISVSSALPSAVDTDGNHYVLRADSKGGKLTIGPPGGESREIRLPATPAQIFPSPDGTKLAMQSSTAVEVVDLEDGRSLWSRSFLQGVRHLSWSVDSRRLAVSAQVGAIVQDGETGEPIRLNCAPWFEKRDTPPATTVSFVQVQNLCERNVAP